MKKSRILIVIGLKIGHCKIATLILFAFVLQSCSKTDDPELKTYTGRIMVYDGPEIGQYDEIDTSYLKPFPDVQVSIYSCEPWSGWLGGGCTPKGKIEETDVTDVEGKYSIPFLGYNYFFYSAQIGYSGDYLNKHVQDSTDYTNSRYWDRITKDFILIPHSLIK